MKEKIFNIFIFLDNTGDITKEYGVTCYELGGSEEIKLKFLLSKVDEDFLTSKKFKFRVELNGSYTETPPYRVINTMIHMNRDDVFEEAYGFFEASSTPIRLITPIQAGSPIKTEITPKIPKNTFNALLSRGIDNITTRRLILEGYNLKKLSSLKKKQLEELGLKDSYVEIFLKLSRPPIPEETVIKLLFESKRTCCICRDSSKPIIIHHIEDWSNSKDHSEENLVVLCLEHHDLAHTKKELSLNLKKNEIRKFKEKWLKKVALEDSKTILGLINDRSARWDYFNVQRIFELVLDLDLEYESIKTYTNLKSKKIVNTLGLLEAPEYWLVHQQPKNFFSHGSQAVLINYYIKSLLEKFIAITPIVDITNKLSKSEIKSLVKPGIFISAQLGFYFKTYKEGNSVKDEIRIAYYKGNGIRVEFLFESWYCTSHSAKFDHLCSHKVITPIILVKTVKEEEGFLTINGSCLAIGSWFDNLKITRNVSF